MKPVMKLILAVVCTAGILTSLRAQKPTVESISSRSGLYGFIENKGQIIDQNNQLNEGVKFLYCMPGLNIQLKANSFSYDAYVIEKINTGKSVDKDLFVTHMREMSSGEVSTHFHRIDVEFVGANSNPAIITDQIAYDYINYYTTGTPEDGIKNVRHFGRIVYKNLYPGIDLEFIAKPGTAKPVEFNFIVNAGADVSLIKWRYNGSKEVQLVNNKLSIATKHGILNEEMPNSYLQETGLKVDIRYHNLGSGVFGFNGQSSPSETLIIDPLPILNWASYYGGTVLDELSAVSPDASGNLHVTGETTSSTNIATTGSFMSTYVGGTVQYGWGGDAFIAKISPSGTRIWGTYFGEKGEDMGWSLKVNSNGDIYVTGDTKSTANIATTGAFQTTMAGSYHDPFLVKFSASGSRIWGTYFGGTGNDRATRNGLVLDPSGNVYICGTNNTANDMWITTVGAYQRTNLSTSAYDEPFVAKFSPSGTLIWGTYYGGTVHDQCFALALDKSNNVYLTGNATSTSLIATTGAYQTALAGGQDAFLAKISANGSSLLWATYFGGVGTDIGNSVAVDANGDVYISGYTTSTSGIASTGAQKTTYGGGSYDGFLAKFSSSGSRLWSTYTGGTDYDLPRSMAVDISGDIIVVGHTATQTGITTTGAFQTTYLGGTYDGYIAKYSNSGVVKMATYFGGPLEDIPWYVEVDSKSNIYIAGRTTSTSGISSGSVFQPTFGGGTYDGFVFKFQDLVADMSVETVDLNPNPLCTNHDADITVKLKNNGPIPAQQMILAVDLPGMIRATMPLNLNGLAIGKDTTIRIPSMVKTNVSGLGLRLTALNMLGDLNSTNDTAKLKVDVYASPSAATLIKGTPFKTTQNLTTGTSKNPDIVAESDTLTYEITPPKNFNNKDYGLTWTAGAINFITKGGRTLSPTYYRFVPANSFSNAKLMFLPDNNITDTAINLSLALIELGPSKCDSNLTRSIFVAPRPKPMFSFNTVCDGDNVVFTNQTTISSGNYTSKWDFGTGVSGDTATTTDVVFRFPTHGTYFVKLTTTSVPYNYISSITLPVVVNEIPKIDYKVFNACFGDSVSFVNKTTISKGPLSYKWDLGNGYTTTKTSPKYKYPVAGSYKVTLTATSNGCSQSLTKNAQEFARPVAGFNVPAVLCDKTELQFTNTSTISRGNMGYTWDIGNSEISTLAHPLFNFDSPGTKTIKMRVLSEFGCADSITKVITLKEAPSADFITGPTCNLSATQFSFKGTKPSGGFVTTFNWDFNGEGTSTAENPTKLFPIVGKKMVTLSVACNNGCTDLITKSVEIKLQSKADFDVPDFCDNEDAVFQNNSKVAIGNLLYKWKFGDGNVSSAQSPRHRYNLNAGTYNVTLVAIVPGGCSDSITKPVNSYANPDASFTYQSSGRLVNFNAKHVGAATYHWNFHGGGSAETKNAQFHFDNYPSGKYNVCLTVTNAANCSSQSCQIINISGGINNITGSKGISVYPNPNNGAFTIKLDEPLNDLSIVIFNNVGALVKVIPVENLKSVYNLNLDAAGVYLVKVTNGGKVNTYKVLVEK